MRPASPPLDAARLEIRADPRLPLGGARPPVSRRPALKAVRPRLLRTAMALTLLIGFLVALAREEAGTGAGPALKPAPLPEPQSPPSWAAAAPFYTLDGEPFTARIHPTLGREDAFVLGAFGEDAPHLRLVLPRGPTPRPTFFVDAARIAAAEGLGVVRIGRTSAIETAFGPVEIADAVLATSGASEAAVERSCLTFRFGELGLVGTGWLCGAAERPGRPAKVATGDHLACLLERLDLAPNAPTIVDPALRRLFAASEHRRLSRCEPPRAVAERPAPERIPPELFAASGTTGASGAPDAEANRAEGRKLGRSRRRERS